MHFHMFLWEDQGWWLRSSTWGEHRLCSLRGMWVWCGAARDASGLRMEQLLFLGASGPNLAKVRVCSVIPPS